MSYNSQGTMDIALRKNGSDYHGLVPYSASGGGTYHHCAGSALVSCSENDYLQVHVNAGSMYGASNGRHTGFTVFSSLIMDYTITLTDTEKKSMEYAAFDVKEWISNAATNRAKKS
ncbi:MAG: hypothetical protein CM15mV75_530 [uncultured marine virus]|nr:MAG: hypothetical protein CM15mV75_530 [uncultured marine virus]